MRKLMWLVGLMFILGCSDEARRGPNQIVCDPATQEARSVLMESCFQASLEAEKAPCKKVDSKALRLECEALSKRTHCFTTKTFRRVQGSHKGPAIDCKSAETRDEERVCGTYTPR